MSKSALLNAPQGEKKVGDYSKSSGIHVVIVTFIVIAIVMSNITRYFSVKKSTLTLIITNTIISITLCYSFFISLFLFLYTIPNTTAPAVVDI